MSKQAKYLTPKRVHAPSPLHPRIVNTFEKDLVNLSFPKKIGSADHLPYTAAESDLINGFIEYDVGTRLFTSYVAHKDSAGRNVFKGKGIVDSKLQNLNRLLHVILCAHSPKPLVALEVLARES